MSIIHKITINNVKLGENLARELKQRRRRTGLRQIDLAIKSRIALRTLQRYESGKHPPDSIAIGRLEAGLELPHGALLDAAAPRENADQAAEIV